MSSPAEGSAADPRAVALRRRLADLGVPAGVEADGGLALVVPMSAAGAAALAARRLDVVAEARACRFTHVALELPAPATPGGDLSVRADVRRAEPGR